MVEMGAPRQMSDGPIDDELIEKNIAFINYLSDLGEGKARDSNFDENVLALLKRPFISNAIEKLCLFFSL